MTGQLPYLPLFFGDFLASTAEWEGEERALYLLLLGHQWSLGSLPADAEKVRRVAGWDAKTFRRYWPTVATKFIVRDGRLVNPRLEQHRSKAVAVSSKRAEAGRKGAESRWGTDDPPNGPANGSAIASAKSLSCHPIQPNPIQELRGQLRSSSVGDLSPFPLSTAPRTANKADENRRKLAQLTATTLKRVAP